MKEQYETPLVEILVFETADVITASILLHTSNMPEGEEQPLG